MPAAYARHLTQRCARLMVSSRAPQVPLNELTIETHLTRLATPTDAVQAGADVRDNAAGGVLFHGLTLEGARWTEGDKEVTNE